MERTKVLSLVVLGVLLAVTAGLAQVGAMEPVETTGGEIAVSEMRGEELPFPVGWVSEAELSAYAQELKGPEEAGALPEATIPVEPYLKGTEHPFPVGWEPE